MRIGALLNFLFLVHLASAQQKTDEWLKNLLIRNGAPLLNHVLQYPDSFHYQVIYTRIDRNDQNEPSFTNFYLHVNKDDYFNPASTVKLPVALLALEKINQYAVNGLTKFTRMQIDSAYGNQTKVDADSSSEDGFPSVAQYIRKIFLVSDNDAYNRLYEFCGQQYINQQLHKKGYQDIRITRRFVPMTEEENRHTNPVTFLNGNKVIFSQPAAYSTYPFDFSKQVHMGKGHWNNKDSLVNEPMDFTKHNNLPLEDLQQILQSVLFPGSVPKNQRFQLTQNDLSFLRKCMCSYPSESIHPAYDTSEFFDSYTKFFYKSDHQKIPTSIRIWNKPGWSFGYLTDAAYVVDFSNHIEFMLSATIYVNKDGILNDNVYEYDEVGYPFFNQLYKVIYQHELMRKRYKRPKWQSASELFNFK